jgi:hypothetical protein
MHGMSKWILIFYRCKFHKNQANTNIYVQRISTSFNNLGFYMDDLIFVNNQIIFLESIKSSLFQNLK